MITVVTLLRLAQVVTMLRLRVQVITLLLWLLGNNSIAKAKIGSWITLAEWDCINGVWTPICVKTEQVDGERIKADTFYKLVNGEFKVVEE